MQIVQFVDEGLGNASHLVEVAEGLALVVDPSRDPTPYLLEAERRGVRIAWTLETHLHADFVSGSRELAARGATIIAPAEGHLAFEHQALKHDDEVRLGEVIVRALATPGHTPEHLSYLIVDDDGTPRVLFSGGSLLVGSVARTDLIAPEQTEPLARALYRSIHEQLLTLPDDVTVYPTHGAGSFCSAPAGAARVTTIGSERVNDPLLAAPDEEAFTSSLLSSLGSYPTYFLRLREVNQRGPRVYADAWPELPLLSAADVRRLHHEGAEIIDARSIERFAEGHIPGSLSIGLRSAFASWLGWLVSLETRLIFVLDEDQDRADLVRQALTIGYEQLAGELDGGIDAWRDAGLPVSQTPLVDAHGAQGHRIIDVRQASEFVTGHVDGAVNLELGSLPEHADAAGPGPLAVMCEHGNRSMTGASILERAGRDDVVVLSSAPDEVSRALGVPLRR